MRLLVPETGHEVDLLLFRSQGMLLVLSVSAVGTCLESAPLEVDLSVVVELAGTAVFVVEIAVAVALGLGEIGGPNRFAMTQGTSAESSGP